MLTYDLLKKGNRTMYEFLYEQMKEDILQGRLSCGEKLPSKRALAEHLGVSVKTIENTYDQLLLEGYIRSEEVILSIVWRRPEAAVLLTLLLKVSIKKKNILRTLLPIISITGCSPLLRGQRLCGKL